MKGLLLLAALLPIVASAAPRAATPKEISAIRSSLERKLKDAPSARFEAVLVENDNVCGMVNAKNSMGGYAGYSPFFGMVTVDTTGKTVAYVLSVGEDEITRKMCADKGIPLPP